MGGHRTSPNERFLPTPPRYPPGPGLTKAARIRVRRVRRNPSCPGSRKARLGSQCFLRFSCRADRGRNARRTPDALLGRGSAARAGSSGHPGAISACVDSDPAPAPRHSAVASIHARNPAQNGVDPSQKRRKWRRSMPTMHQPDLMDGVDPCHFSRAGRPKLPLHWRRSMPLGGVDPCHRSGRQIPRSQAWCGFSESQFLKRVSKYQL